jgi:hypothetical protein
VLSISQKKLDIDDLKEVSVVSAVFGVSLALTTNSVSGGIFVFIAFMAIGVIWKSLKKKS